MARAVAVRAQGKAFSAFKGLNLTVPDESRTTLTGVYRGTLDPCPMNRAPR